MSIFEMTDPATGKKETRNISQNAQNAITNHNYTQGKSSDQGNRGIMQGSEGWKAQYGGKQYDQINPIISRLASQQSFNMPKITDKLTTQEGFNQALQVVGARNNAKMEMANRNVLGGVLGSLIQGQNQRYNTDSDAALQREGLLNRLGIAKMGDATQRRGQDFDKQYRDATIENGSTSQENLKNYYQGMIKNGEEQNRISAIKAERPSGEHYTNPLDDRIKLEKILASDAFNGLSDEMKRGAMDRYAKTGEIPTGVSGEDGWWEDSRKLTYASDNQQPAQQQGQAQHQQQQMSNAEQQKPQATGNLLNALSAEYGIKRSELRLSDDGFKIIFPDGRKIDVETANNILKG